MDKKTHYDVLGLSPAATPEEIHSAFVKARARFLEAEQSGDPAAASPYRAAAEAYEVLSIPDARQHYDKMLEETRPPATPQAVADGMFGERRTLRSSLARTLATASSADARVRYFYPPASFRVSYAASLLAGAAFLLTLLVTAIRGGGIHVSIAALVAIGVWTIIRLYGARLWPLKNIFMPLRAVAISPEFLVIFEGRQAKFHSLINIRFHGSGKRLHGLDGYSVQFDVTDTFLPEEIPLEISDCTELSQLLTQYRSALEGPTLRHRGDIQRADPLYRAVTGGASLRGALAAFRFMPPEDRTTLRRAAQWAAASATLPVLAGMVPPIPWHRFLPVDGGPHLAAAIAGPEFAKVAGARAVVPLGVDADAAYTVYVRFDQASRCWKFPVDPQHPVRLFVPPVEGLFYYTNSRGPGPLLRRRDPLYFTVDDYDNQTSGRLVRITSGQGGDIPVSPSEVAHCMPLVTN